MKDYKFTSASLLVTEDCNLRCTYCFETHKKVNMSVEVAKKTLDTIAINAKETNTSNFHAMIFGGEPMLNFELVKFILEYGIKLSNIHQVRFTASMITNCTVLTDDMIDFLSSYVNVMSIQLSIDGGPEVNDMYRVTRDGSGSFAILEPNIRRWLNLYEGNPGNLSLHGCVNQKTLPYLYDSFKYFVDKYGIYNQWYMPIHSELWDDADVTIYSREMLKIADDLIKQSVDTGTTKDLMSYAPIDKCMAKGFSDSPCGAGKTFMSVVANGDIYPCHQFYYIDIDDNSDNFKLGNILTGYSRDKNTLFDAYNRSDLSCMKDNPDCDCYGCYICIADNYSANGSILSTVGMNGPRCEMSKVEKEIQTYVVEVLKGLDLLPESSHSCSCGQSQDNTSNELMQRLKTIEEQNQRILMLLEKE